MRAYVYTDKSLERFAGRFVWLSVNTEAAANAAFLQRYPIPALPMQLVLDPDGKVIFRYVGGATVSQLTKMLDDLDRKGSRATSDALLVSADRQAADGHHKEAVKTYDTAIANASKRWPALGRAAESLLFSLAMIPDRERCTTRALELYPRVKGTASAANVAATGLSCAIGAKRVQDIEKLEQYTREVFD